MRSAVRTGRCTARHRPARHEWERRGASVAHSAAHFPELFIALTGCSPAHRERSRLAGFDHYLVKPLDLATLEELLASA